MSIYPDNGQLPLLERLNWSTSNIHNETHNVIYNLFTVGNLNKCAQPRQSNINVISCSQLSLILLYKMPSFWKTACLEIPEELTYMFFFVLSGSFNFLLSPKIGGGVCKCYRHIRGINLVYILVLLISLVAS